MKKFLQKTTCLIFVFLIAFCLVSCNTTQTPKGPKSLIYVIGDGMGFHHLQVCKEYFNLPDYEFEKYFFASATTYSLSNETTDSAAGGTALATGNKVPNGTVAMRDGQNLTTIMDYAQKYNYKTAIITNDTLYGATPAAFSGHATSRDDSESIIKTQAESNIDLLVGAYYDDQQSFRSYYEKNDYVVYNDYLLGYEYGNDKAVLNYKFSTDHETNSLQKVVETTLKKIGDQPFAMMVESAYIDKYSHANDFTAAMWEVRHLYDLMEYLFDYAKQHNVAIILTADHETGGLGADRTYRTGNHSAANVPFYMYNIPAEPRTFVDNIDIFGYALKAITPAK